MPVDAASIIKACLLAVPVVLCLSYPFVYFVAALMALYRRLMEEEGSRQE